MPGYVLTVTLNPAIDRTVIGDKARLSAGGKGINVSRALNILGVKNIATGIVGGENGDDIIRLLEKEKIKNDFFRIKGETRTNLTLISPRGRRMSRKIEKGPKVSAAEFKTFKRKFRSLLKGCGFVVFSGANANGLSDSAYAELMKIASGRKIKAALDTRDAPLKRGLAARPFIIKPNLKEAEYLLGSRIRSRESASGAAELVCGRGAKIAIVTLGAGGAAASDGKRIVYAQAPKIKAVNNVGCGDAFLAGFIAYHLKGKGLGDCLNAAVRIGAAAAISVKPGDFKWRYFAATRT